MEQQDGARQEPPTGHPQPAAQPTFNGQIGASGQLSPIPPGGDAPAFPSRRARRAYTQQGAQPVISRSTRRQIHDQLSQTGHLSPAVQPESGPGPLTSTPEPLAGDNLATSPTASAPSAQALPGPASAKKGGSVVLTLMSGMAELFLTLGAVLALFVVWQLYVTTWEVQGATAATIETFKRANATAATQISQTKRTDPPPVTEIGAEGEAFATLHVPRWDKMIIPIEQGTTSRVLDTGYAGHYVKTAGPGEVGNFAIAGHRRSYGNSFRRVEELQKGDPLIVETAQAWLVYVVDNTEVVLPTNGGPILPVPNQPDAQPSERMMTMTTCHPEYGNSERFIVYSKLAYWVPRGEGRPAALNGKA